MLQLAGNIARAPSSDPYVVVKLLNPLTGASSEPARSDTRWRSCNPAWCPEEKFHFSVPKASLNDLRIFATVYDQDSISSDDYLGECVTKVVGELSGEEGDIRSLDLLAGDTGEKIEGSSVQLTVKIAPSLLNLTTHQVIYQYCRWTPTGGWGSTFPGHLLPSDPGGWSDKNGIKWGASLGEVEPDMGGGGLLV